MGNLGNDGAKHLRPLSNDEKKNEKDVHVSPKFGANALVYTPIFALVENMPIAELEKLPVWKQVDALSAIFNDAELMATYEAFLNNGMNISETARILYMHRNTLMYRLNKLKDIAGLDIKLFDDAVTFAFMHLVFIKKSAK